MTTKNLTSAKKKEENTIKCKVKFCGLRLWPWEEILKMCKASYPQLGLEKIIGFTLTPKGKEIFVVQGRVGNLIISDAEK